MKQSVSAGRDSTGAAHTMQGDGGHLTHPLQREIDASPRQRMQQNRLTQLRDTSARQTPNGLPSSLRQGVEALSGMDMGSVVVHRNSSMPAQLNALAYAQGNQIHLGPGQDAHLPHEAWHVVQQRQGRVNATAQLGGAHINDDAGLEREADAMGAMAAQRKALPCGAKLEPQTAMASAEPVQLLRVRENATSFLGGNVSKERIRTYFYEYEIPLMVQRVGEYCRSDPLIAAVNTAYTAYKNGFSANAASTTPDWNAVVVLLNTLVTDINTALDDAPGVPSGYAANDDGNWGDQQTGVRAAHAQVSGAAATAPQNRELAGIRTIPYSAVKEHFPPTLFRLIRDIYGSWRSGQVMDERSAGEQASRTVTSNTPGALRSWHMNTSQTLPARAPGATPANAAALEAHYQATSGVMNALGVAPPGPDGYAEYTGTGIMNDAHISKIVLDYRRGLIFLTLTHYQFWTDADGAFATQGQAAGTNNPWFKIDMNS